MKRLFLPENKINLYFKVSVFSKGLFSLVEVIAGTLLLIVPISLITEKVVALAHAEIVHDPDDFIATHILALARHTSVPSDIFVSIYLLSRGLIKLGLVWGLLKRKLWAYPSSLAVLGLFVLYQIYEIAMTGSLLLIALSLFDLVVMFFIWREYVLVKMGEGLPRLQSAK